jgi:pyruvate-formate lyase-activating enzyme
MIHHWPKVEAAFLSSILALVIWMTNGIISHETAIAVLSERVKTIQVDIKDMKDDIHSLIAIKENEINYDSYAKD